MGLESLIKKHSRSRKWFKRLALAGALSIGIGGLGAGYTYHELTDTSQIKLSKKEIRRMLYSNSKVYYSDGETEIGNLGGTDEQRVYVPIDKIPQNCIDAAVSAEDKNFWKHSGLDYYAIARAAFADVKASLRRGRKTIVQGGSTLTQQAAKNILHLRKGKGRSFAGKIEEAQYAIWLEENFTKKEILEMLLNQFHVIGTNVGIGSAARYYFDLSDPSKLNTAECAYIAGTFKAPRNYDPLIRGGADKDKDKRKKINRRVSYVLRRMKEDGKLTDEEYSSAIDELNNGLPFKRGDIIPRRNSIIDRVKEEARKDRSIKEALKKGGVDLDKLAVEGVKIYTTIDNNAQREVVYAAGELATEVEGWLKGFRFPRLPRHYKTPPIEKHKFYYGEAVSISDEGVRVKVDGLEGIVDMEGIRRIVSFDKRHKKRRSNVRINDEDITSFLKKIKKGSVLYVSVREKEGNKAVLDIEQPPSFEVANFYMDKSGAIKVLQGSYLNEDYDYIFDGKTQVGSSLKPFLQLLGMQYMWEPYDVLDNRPRVFPVFKRNFTIEPYLPSNHGSSNEDETTLWYALVHSENIAHLSLLYHLLDKVKEFPEELKLAMDLAGMSREQDESDREYRRKLEDKFGLLFTPRYKKAIDFEEAKRKFIEDNSPDNNIVEAVMRLHPDYMIKDDGVPKNRMKDVMDFFNASYSVMKRKAAEKEDIKDHLTRRADRLRSLLDSPGASLSEIISASAGFYLDDGRLRYAKESGISLNQSDLVRLAENEKVFDKFKENASQFTLVEGIPFSFFDYMDKNIGGLKPEREYLDPKNIIYHPAFNQVLGEHLFYKTLKDMGLKSEPPIVPSMILGAFEMHPYELAVMYNSLLNGQKVEPYIIRKITAPDGRVIYQHEDISEKVVLDDELRRIIRNTLRDVTLYGTGKYLNGISCGKNAILEYSGRVNHPAEGKTGTLTDNRGGLFTVSFDSVTGVSIIGNYSYKGDANSPMRYGSNKVWGSSVLPVTAAAIKAMKEKDEKQMISPTDIHLDRKGVKIKGICEHPPGNPYCCAAFDKDSRRVLGATYL